MTFNGFTPPVSNYFRMPNEWVNISAKITNLAELKVVEYVLRHTWGYNEYDGKAKPITTDEFMHGRKDRNGNRIDNGTGLSNKSVVEGLKKAIEHGYLISEVDGTDKARIVKAYALKMFSSESDVKNLHTENSYVDSTHQMCRIYIPAMKDLHSDCVDPTQRSEKDTKEKHFKKNNRERKNDASQQTSKGTSKPEATHSSIHSSLSHSQSSFSSQETKPEEVTLSEDEQRIYEYACQSIFKAKPPFKTPKLQSECAEIAKHVKTVEQFTSLVQFVRALPYIQGQVHLKNLVNELNGWLQIQSQLPPAPEELPPVTDDEIAEKVSGFCRIYKDDNVEEHIQKVIQIQQQVGMDNNEMYDLLFEAKEETTYSGVRDMQSFFRQISRILKQKHKILI